MALALVISGFVPGITLAALFLTMAAPRTRPRPILMRKKTVMALATLGLGLSLFALFFGLVAACDRL